MFFVIDHANRQVLHVHVTSNPTSAWAAQQMVECCAWDRRPPRFLVRDRDSCYGATFDRRVRTIGIAQVRTPFRSPRANAIAERWVRSVRTECLDRVFIFNDRHLQKVLAEYVSYFNDWRPHRIAGTTGALRTGSRRVSSKRPRSRDHRDTRARRASSRLSGSRMTMSRN